ncbi:hypothetical protein D3C76_1790290 [compost metagenome]
MAVAWVEALVEDSVQPIPKPQTGIPPTLLIMSTLNRIVLLVLLEKVILDPMACF